MEFKPKINLKNTYLIYLNHNEKIAQYFLCLIHRK